VAAGLLARNAVQRGLRSKPWVKTSLAPGSKVVMEYYAEADLIEPLEALGFHLVGYGCTTCIGNSGPLPDEVSRDRQRAGPGGRLGAERQPQLRGAHQPRREDELPRLAAAVRRLRAGRDDGTSTCSTSRWAAAGRRGRLPQGHLADRRRGRPHGRGPPCRRHVHLLLRRRLRATSAGTRSRSRRATLRLGPGLHLRPPAAVLRGPPARAGGGATTSRARACSPCWRTR
jgi:hypothetical protein